jgi:hypothetical protein
MPNTVIALKKSATPSSAPADLANGELALNYADGKLYYKNAAGLIAEFAPTTSSNYFGTVNANSTLLIADTTNDVLTIAPGNNISIVGDAVNDKLTVALTNDVNIPGKLNVGGNFTHTSGDFLINNMSGAGGSSEGGEIKFANGTSATQLLSGPVSIDIYENRIRFFETNSPNRGAFINLAAAGASVGTDLLAGSSGTDTVARTTASAAFDKANAANVLAFNALPNTSGVTFNGNLTVSQNLSADRIFSTNNGNGENFKVGDDSWIGDTNLADTVRIKGQQNASNAYILFGDNDGIRLGRQGSNALTYGANTVWHAGNDGAGTGLDADLLDGQHGSYYGIATDVTSAFTQANAAPNISNSYTVVVGAASNGWANSVGTSGNTYATAYAVSVGTSGNSYTNAVGNSSNAYSVAIGASSNAWANTISNTRALASNGWANSVGTSGNTYATAVGTSGNSYTNAVGTSGNTYATAYAVSVGTSGNSYATAVGTSGNSYANAVGTYANSTFVKLTAASQTITGNLNIVGDLTLSGNTFVIDATRLEIDDPLIYLAGNNYASDIVDIGFIANYVNATGSNVHTGLYREHVDKMYYLFQGYDKEPENNHLGALSNNMTLAVLNADLRTSNLVLGGANAILTINGAFNKANAALPNTSGSTFNGDLNVSGNLTSQTLSTRSNVINFGTAMSILPNGMIMIYGDINMLT